MAKIENYKFSIHDAFRQCFYIVPDYQREFVWSDKEVLQLLDDINAEFENSKEEYFIGTILVSPEEATDHYAVIDGQQRLTTFFLLLCALKNLFIEGEQVEFINNLLKSSYPNDKGEIISKLKLDPRYEHANKLMTLIVDANSDPPTTRDQAITSGIPSFGSLENLLDAFDWIYRYLEDNYLKRGCLQEYWGYLANNVVFIQIQTDINSALVIFETINERGIGLNPMDLLKNLLFTQVKKEEFTRLKEEWKGITKPLESNKERPLRFLRYFLMANYPIESRRKDSIIREDEIYDWFRVDKNAETSGYKDNPFEFTRLLSLNVTHYIYYSSGYGNDGNPNIAMNNLRKLCGGAFSQHYILLLAASNFPKNIFDHFIVQLENFLFYYIFTKSPTRELERNFSSWADELRQIGKENSPQAQREAYNAFLEHNFVESITNKKDELMDYLKRYTLNSMQQYRSRYLLAKITQYVELEYTGRKQQEALDDYMKVDIEHILPSKPDNMSLDRFKNENPGAEYYEYVNRLGNLALLEEPLNRSIGNKSFAEKTSAYKKSKYYLTRSISELTEFGVNTSINRISRQLMSFDEWNTESIEQRQNMLTEIAMKIWQVEKF